MTRKTTMLIAVMMVVTVAYLIVRSVTRKKTMLIAVMIRVMMVVTVAYLIVLMINQNMDVPTLV